ncbi:OPT superfamily oligopeptide transporter [Microthyrium microscopicum]|uniref:OPT superfamily oligopeptide transporter n=1 Tax=Microthyrium microscopicum TaxID=703497 RepID=A0A6A6UP03_9PEZI|nr:OPT superfamily oligopeptide transporter [Microthyrium microscopicum]
MDIIRNLNTPRMWILSMLFAIFGSSINLFFSLRYPSVSISPIIALLLAHPLGLLWDQVFKTSNRFPSRLPTRVDSLDSQVIDESSPLISPASTNGHFPRHSDPTYASRWTRLRLWLSQGTWNEQEHCCVFIASNVSFGFAFATDVIVEQTKFYGQDVTLIYQLLLTLSTQILGYAIAGMTRSFLVRPAGMVWPGTLVAKAMLSSLHKNENKPAGNWTISPFRFFLYVFLGSSAFYFLPGFLMPALSYFSVLTWFAPNNVVVANLFGVASGLGLFPLTFDWSQIAYIGSPLIVPFWAAMNVICGLAAVIWILAPILYYSNTLYSSYMPILSSAVFDNKGEMYNVSRVLTSNFVFDGEAYKDYSRVFLPTTYILSYALQFAALPALVVHTIGWYGPDTWKQCKASWGEAKMIYTKSKVETSRVLSHQTSRSSMLSRQSTRSRSARPDVERSMTDQELRGPRTKSQPDVPILWYILTGVSMTAVGIFVVEYYDVHLPWYGLLLAIGLCSVLFVPIGIIQAITNQQSSLYLISQLLCGALFPGKPVANMVFVTYAYITSTQGLKFASDLKLGQVYMAIPPRLLFKLQLAATVISSLTQVGVLNWMLSHIPNICTPLAANGFTCPLARVHFNGSILWGVIGPQRFFGRGQLYRSLIWAFPLGALLPLAVWLFARRRGLSMQRGIVSMINFPLILGSLSWIPPATALNFSVWGVLCYIFNYRIKRGNIDWWLKYNLTLSAALDSGLAVGVLVIFFALVYPGFADGFSWWGTEVYKQGCDWKACPYKEVPSGGFGPKAW